MAKAVTPQIRPPIPHYLPAEPPAFVKKRTEAREAAGVLPVPSDKKYTNWERLGIPEMFLGMAIGGVSPILTISQADYETGAKTIAIPLAKAIKDWPDKIEEYLLGEAFPAGEHYFSALSGALYTDGAAIFVPDRVKVDITAEFGLEAGKLNAYRTVIVVGEGAEVTISELTGKAGRKKTLLAHGVEVYLKPGAQLKYHALQRWPGTVNQFVGYRGHIEQDARLDWLIGSFGAKHSQVRVESALAGKGAESKVHAVYYADDSQHLDHDLIANHLVGQTTSDTYARGIAAETGKAIYRGMIKIQRGAHGSSADQNGHAMLMANTAHVDAIPALEIDADDVTAGHGATVGQVDEEQLFYLMARGISREEAVDMIIRGFFEHLFKDIPDAKTRQAFWRAVEAKQK